MPLDDALPDRAQVTKLIALFAGVAMPLYVLGEYSNDQGRAGLPSDAAVRNLIHGSRLEDQAALMHAVTWLSHTATAAITEALILLRLRVTGRRDEAHFLATAAGGSWLLHVLVKRLVGRQRPHLQDRLPFKTSSYPSGHVMATTTLIVALVVLAWRSSWRWPTAVLGCLWVLLTGASRVALDEHHPSDVVAGMVAPLIWVGGVSAIQRGRHEREDWAEREEHEQ